MDNDNIKFLRKLDQEKKKVDQLELLKKRLAEQGVTLGSSRGLVNSITGKKIVGKVRR